VHKRESDGIGSGIAKGEAARIGVAVLDELLIRCPFDGM
jgi:hypothetical protein